MGPAWEVETRRPWRPSASWGAWSFEGRGVVKRRPRVIRRTPRRSEGPRPSAIAASRLRLFLYSLPPSPVFRPWIGPGRTGPFGSNSEPWPQGRGDAQSPLGTVSERKGLEPASEPAGLGRRRPLLRGSQQNLSSEDRGSERLSRTTGNVILSQKVQGFCSKGFPMYSDRVLAALSISSKSKSWARSWETRVFNPGSERPHPLFFFFFFF